MSDADSDWTDLIVGERMQLDQEFGATVENSQFSRQQWGMVMTAVEFDIENPESAEHARLVADTSKLPSVLPELDRLADQSGMAATGGSAPDAGRSGGGLLAGIKDALGLGGKSAGDDGDGYSKSDQEAAEELAQEYASQLQQRLERHGRWKQVRRAATND